ncbi:MAG: hypothetical protein ACRDN6_01400 [Gaiellaceae bacterium]
MRRGLSVLALLALLAADTTRAALARDALIRPGVGIGKVELGMTLAQVRRVMGRHDTGTSERRGFGVRYLELVWDRGPEDYFSVGLLGSPRRLRVVIVSTTRPAERTASGIGPGTALRRLLRTVPGLRCRDVFPAGGGVLVQREYVLTGGRGRETVFVPGKWRFYWRDTTKQVAYVMVRDRGASGRVQARPC